MAQPDHTLLIVSAPRDYFSEVYALGLMLCGYIISHHTARYYLKE